MSEDSYTEVTSQSWFSRIGGALKGILIGLVLFAVAFPLLFWNEGRAVRRHKTLKEGGGAVISVTSDRVDAANAGKLIHATGRAVTDATLKDATFGVTVNALKLRRAVEMYQWRETSESKTKKKLGGGTETTTTYSYSKVWSDKPISSTDFKKPQGHQNPGSMPYESTLYTAGDVRLGAFKLSSSLVGRIQNFEALPAGDESALPEALRDKIKPWGEGYYLGADPASPRIGDTKIRFEVVKPTEVSVVAGQVEHTFQPYRAKAGGTIELLHMGTHGADAMIQRAQESNKMLTFILRIVGFLVMFIGLTMIFRLLAVLADVLPILGDILGAGTGLISFLLAAVLSLITIAVAWIIYRPLIGVVLLVGAIGLAVVIIGRLKSARAAKAAS